MESTKKNFFGIKTIHYIFIFIAIVFGGFVFGSFITAPFTGDIEVFIAAENQVKYKEANGLKAIFEAWELKGIANRFLMYILYRITSIFISYGDVVKFEFLVKLIYAFIIIGCSAFSAYLISDNFRSRFEIFDMECLVVFATYTASQLQAEMTCVVLSILVASCIIRGGVKFSVLSGIIGAFLILFKVVFILLFIVALLMAVFYKGIENINKRTITISITSFIICEFVLLGGIYCYYPKEFKDMLMASEFQSTLFSRSSEVSLHTIIDQFTSHFITAFIAIPFLLLAIVCVSVLFFYYLKKKKAAEITILFVAWLLIVDIIVASNTYFIYHYFLLILPGFFSLLSFVEIFKLEKAEKSRIFCISILATFLLFVLCKIMEKPKNEPISIINYSTILLAVIHILILVIFLFISGNKSKFRFIVIFLTSTMCLFLWINTSSILSWKHKNERELLKISEKICKNVFPEDFTEEPILFLDDGRIPFCIDVPSYSRYFFNLPMQRWELGDDWEIQKSEYEKLMVYNGKYIVYSSWFRLSRYPELSEKINREYTPLENGSIYMFSPDWQFFKLHNVDEEELRMNSGIYILVRKDKIM